jgi:hypothetical protein
MRISNKEQGMSNIEGEVSSQKYFYIQTSTSIFDIPCSLFDILFYSYTSPLAPKYLSASSAAIQPLPAAVTAWR